jgi:hypothetical protein
MRRVAVLLGLLVAPAAAKPMTVRVDRVLASAEIVAEVEVLWVHRALRPGVGGSMRVRVTDDPRRIHRGARFCGAELTLRPFPAGACTCTMEMELYLRLRKRVLLVVDAQRVVHLAGDRVAAGYRVRGWYDYNACWLRCDDRALGKPEGRSKFRVSTRGLRTRYGDEEAVFWAMVAPRVCGVAEPLPAAEIARLVAALAHHDRGRRDRAQQVLLERGRYSIAALRAAAKGADDPEQRRGIRAVLAGLAEHAHADDIARGLTDPGQKAWVVRAALPRLEGAEREAALEYLAQPDPDAQRDTHDDEHDD